MSVSQSPGSASSPVVLPKGATGVRSWRRERIRRQKRNRRLAAVGIFLLVLVIAVLVVLQQPAGEHAPRGQSASAPIALPTKGPLPSLFVVTGDSSGAEGIAVIIPLPSGRGGSILVVPPDTYTEVVPGGQLPVSAALVSTSNAPGDQKMLSTVENMLGISISSVVVADDAQLAALLTPAGPLAVTLPEAIAPPAGAAGPSFPAGVNTVRPDNVSYFLTDQDAAGQVDQATRFGNLLQAWSFALRGNPTAAPSQELPPTTVPPTTAPPPTTAAPTTTAAGGTGKTTPPPSTTTTAAPPTTTSLPPVTAAPLLGAALTQLSRGAAAVDLLPVDAIPGESPGASTNYQVNQAELLALLPGMVPGQPGVLEPRPKIQLLNGTGGLGLDEEAMVKLEPWVNVSLSGNACTPQPGSAQFSCFGYQKTRIITYDARGRSDAQRIARLLGTGEILTSSGSSDIVDVTVIVGADFHVSG